MKIPPNSFDTKGLMRISSEFPKYIKWHPLFALDEMYSYFAVVYNSNKVKLYSFLKNNNDNNKIILEYSFSFAEPVNIDWSPDGQYIFVGCKSGKISKIDTYKNKLTNDFISLGNVSNKPSISYLKISPNGELIATGSDDGSLMIWNSISGLFKSKFKCFTNHSDSISSISFSSNNRLIVTGSKDCCMRLWDISSGKTVFYFYDDTLKKMSQVNTVSFSPQNRYIISGLEEGTLNLWKLRSKKFYKRYVLEKCNQINRVHCVKFTQDDRYIISVSKKKILLWDTYSGDINPNFYKNVNDIEILYADITSDCKYIAIVTHDGIQILSFKDMSIVA